MGSMSRKSDSRMLQKEVKVDCDCNISQLVVKVFTKLLGILDCDSKCQGYSRTQNYIESPPRGFRKRKKGGKGSRMRRNARRAETETETGTETETETETAPPDPPPRN